MGAAPQGDSEENRILLVEDEFPAIRLFQLAVEELDDRIEVDTASDGQQVLDQLFGESGAQRRPDVVVLDLDLQKVGGIEVLREIRATPETADLPVVVVTHQDGQQVIEECRRLGVDDYIVKPDDYAGLLRVARRIIATWGTEDADPPSALETEHPHDR